MTLIFKICIFFDYDLGGIAIMTLISKKNLWSKAHTHTHTFQLEADGHLSDKLCKALISTFTIHFLPPLH